MQTWDRISTHRLEPDRRRFLQLAGAAAAGAAFPASSWAQAAPPARSKGIEVLFPLDRVPLSFIIDDSTCLVNMGHFCTPQFGDAFPDRKEYQRPWKTWPREIPDRFVREFGEWCSANGVKGKYSIVPNPACVGYLDRELPGWSRRELLDSLNLVRDLMLPDWDIHPEMITHTRVIDMKTGKPFPDVGPATIENSFPREKKTVDELAAYIAYALQILKNCDLPCEGITTPGGFGNLVKSELSLAVHDAVRDVYQTEIPHYFKYVHGGEQSTEPILEHVRGVGTNDVRVTVNIPAGTGDWFGGWQGVSDPDGARYCNEDATAGRMVDLIEKRQPALMLCHWPGMYCNGTKIGFQAFQNVVTALNDRYADVTIWMKLSEIARYWAAKELTEIRATDEGWEIDAPFATSRFTVRDRQTPADAQPRVSHGGETTALRRVEKPAQLAPGTFQISDAGTTVCFDLAKGTSRLSWASN